MSKKLLVFCGGYLISGQEIVTLNYLKELLTLGTQIHCITNAWGNGEFEKRLQNLSINFTSVKLGFIYPRKLIWTLDTIIRFPNALREIKNVISEFQPDAFYHTSFRTIYMLQFFLKAKHIFHVHENIEKTFFNRYVLKSIAKNTKKFIAVSNVTKHYLIDCGIDESKIEVLHNGTEVLPLCESTLKLHSFNFGLVGQIAPHKGHDLVIEAMAMLQQKNIQIFLQIFGRGEDDYINSLQKKITAYNLDNSVKWMGFVEDFDKIYEQLYVLLLPTLTVEPFGMGIIEGGVRNVLTLATNSGGPKEIIKPNFNGWLFESGSVLDFVIQIENILKKDFDYRILAQNNYDKICNNFNIRKQAILLVNILFNA